MPIWFNVTVVLLMAGVVLLSARALSKAIDQSVETSQSDEGASDEQ